MKTQKQLSPKISHYYMAGNLWPVPEIYAICGYKDIHDPDTFSGILLPRLEKLTCEKCKKTIMDTDFFK